MPVLTRSALEASPLADLHELASELGIDGYRKLRRDDLVGTLLERGDGASAGADGGDADDAGRSRGGRARDDGDGESRGRGRGRRGGRDDRSENGRGGGRGRGRESEAQVDTADEDGPRGPRRGRTRGGSDADGTDGGGEDRSPRGRSRGEGRPGDRADDEAPARGRGRGRDRDDRGDRDDEEGTPEQVEGALSLAGSGSGFVRVADDGPSEGDVYVSAAQIKRCELVEGDRVGGPVRPARRSERHPSLIRVETINGRPADEEAPSGTPVHRQAAAWPHERLALGSDDPTVKAIEWLVPIGRGSRATITGAARAGKTEALRRLATAVAGLADDGIELIVALAGVRPEEIGDWADLGVSADAATDLGAPHDKQLRVIEDAIERGRRIAARGGHAVVAIDSLDDIDETAARRVLASARRLQGEGSLTVVATSTEPVGGESTVVALDVALTSTGRFPALDLAASGTLRPELLVGEAGAAAIAAARAETLG